MCDFSGKPIEITPGTPKDVAGIRQSLISLLSGGVGQGATPYGGPIGAQTNPLQLMAANMMAKKMGYGGYNTPGYYNLQGMPNMGGMTMTPGTGYRYDETGKGTPTNPITPGDITKPPKRVLPPGGGPYDYIPGGGYDPTMPIGPGNLGRTPRTITPGGGVRKRSGK